MQTLMAFLGAAGLIYALGREHGARHAAKRDQRPAVRKRSKSSDWSPFDGFWSDR